jgi:hypothetical protein
MWIRLTLDFQTGCHFKESRTDLVEECHYAVTIGVLTEWSTFDRPYVREEAGTHRYSVGTGRVGGR